MHSALRCGERRANGAHQPPASCARQRGSRVAITSQLQCWPDTTTGKSTSPRDATQAQRYLERGAVGGYNEYIVNSIRALRQETNRWTTQRLYNGSSNTCAAAFRAARRRCTTSATCDNSSVSASSRGTKSRAPTWTPS